jgi:hypothetical protein
MQAAGGVPMVPLNHHFAPLFVSPLLFFLLTCCQVSGQHPLVLSGLILFESVAVFVRIPLCHQHDDITAHSGFAFWVRVSSASPRSLTLTKSWKRPHDLTKSLFFPPRSLATFPRHDLRNGQPQPSGIFSRQRLSPVHFDFGRSTSTIRPSESSCGHLT